MIQQIISNSYKKAKRISINSDSKFIFFSDCHRGNNSYTDDFSHKDGTLQIVKTVLKGPRDIAEYLK